MANPISQFINDRFVQPAVEKALSANHPPAFGTAITPETSLAKAIGQPHDANYALLYSVYKLNTDVSGCVHKWAGGVTGPGWRITTMDDDITVTDALKKEMQEIERWLRNPNPSKLFASMLYEGVTHWGIAGNFYWYVSEDKKGRPLEIWPMHPALTKVVATERGEVLGYTMRQTNGQEVKFDGDEVLDFALPNPTSDIYGESPLELVLEEAGIDLQALRSNKAIFQNGMNPSAVLMMDESAKREDAAAMTAMLKQAHTGSGNQHKIVALSKTKDFKPWTMSNRDLEFLKLRDLATSKVTTAYRIPKVMLGHHNAGDYATTKFLIRDTYNHVYRPMQEIIEAIITERLIHRFNPELRFELIRPDASDPDDIRKDQMAAKDKGILTADEVRDEAFGKDPLEVLEPTDEIASIKEDAPTEEEQKPDTDAADTAEDAPKSNKTVTKALEATNLDTIADERSQQIDVLAKPLVAPVAGYFAAEEADLLDRLPTFLTVAGLDAYLSLNAANQDTVLWTLIGSLVRPALQAGALAAQLQVSITLSTTQTNPFINEYLKTETAQRVRGINQTTKDSLRSTLEAGIKANESQLDLMSRIEAVFSEAKGYRAGMIANNEVINAYSYANDQALQIMFEQGAITHAMWLTAEDERVRPEHAALNRVVVPFDQPFPDDLVPGEAINCRCTTVGLTPDQAEASQ
jgi:HK97 family phage portal protein